MFNPKYRILLTSKCFPADGVVGLGTQLISLIKSVKPNLAPHLWYGASVEAVGKEANKQGLKGFQLSKIGTDSQFIEYCSGIDQFIWGVFLCVDKTSSPQNVELEAEDRPFRLIKAKGILLEIRAFDTTHFAIYAEDFELIEKISKIYSVQIEKCIIS